MLVDVVGVEPALGDQLMHQRQRQRAVGARLQGQMAVALVGGFAAARVDAPQLGAGPLGLLREGPEMQVRRNAVAAPDDDEPAAREVLQVHAQLAAVGGLQPGRARAGADGAVQQRGTQPVEKARCHRLPLQQAHGAGVAVRQDGLRIARRDGLQPLRNVAQRLVPAHALELAAALGAGALHREQHPLGVLHPLRVAGDLGAQRAVGGRVVRVALDADHPVVGHGDAHSAGVGAVVRAGAAHGTFSDGGRTHRVTMAQAEAGHGPGVNWPAPCLELCSSCN